MHSRQCLHSIVLMTEKSDEVYDRLKKCKSAARCACAFLGSLEPFCQRATAERWIKTRKHIQSKLWVSRFALYHLVLARKKRCNESAM
eukprot:1072043-Amphidinium_carterae.2